MRSVPDQLNRFAISLRIGSLTMQDRTGECSKVHCSTVKYSLVQLGTVQQYSTVRHGAVQCSASFHNTWLLHCSY